MKTEKRSVTLDDFSMLYKKYGPMVLRRCRFLLKNEDTALDAMQDVFVRIIERHTRLSGICSSFFYTVATSVCLNRLRALKRRQGPEFDIVLEEIADNTAAFHEDITDASILLDCIFSGSRDDTRKMAELHYIDGYTLEETAARMGMSVSGVRKRLSGLKKRAVSCISLILIFFIRFTDRSIVWE